MIVLNEMVSPSVDQKPQDQNADRQGKGDGDEYQDPQRTAGPARRAQPLHRPCHDGFIYQVY